jgi:hypothetical protein
MASGTTMAVTTRTATAEIIGTTKTGTTIGGAEFPGLTKR